MHNIVIDLLLCCFIYSILLAIIFIRENKKKRRNDSSDGDDEGGLPIMTPPEIDLPPGICLPDDPRVKKHEPEEVFA
jgi:hypothetical protein